MHLPGRGSFISPRVSMSILKNSSSDARRERFVPNNAIPNRQNMVTHKANRHTMLFPGALAGGDSPLVVGGVCAVDYIQCVRWKHEAVLVSIAFEFVE